MSSQAPIRGSLALQARFNVFGMANRLRLSDCIISNWNKATDGLVLIRYQAEASLSSVFDYCLLVSLKIIYNYHQV